MPGPEWLRPLDWRSWIWMTPYSESSSFKCCQSEILCLARPGRARRRPIQLSGSTWMSPAPVHDHPAADIGWQAVRAQKRASALPDINLRYQSALAESRLLTGENGQKEGAASFFSLRGFDRAVMVAQWYDLQLEAREPGFEPLPGPDLGKQWSRDYPSDVHATHTLPDANFRHQEALKGACSFHLVTRIFDRAVVGGAARCTSHEQQTFPM